jgi:hypothetical protein
LGISNNFSDETHTAGYDCRTPVFSLISKNDHYTVGKFFNILKRRATENNLSVTPG